MRLLAVIAAGLGCFACTGNSPDLNEGRTRASYAEPDTLGGPHTFKGKLYSDQDPNLAISPGDAFEIRLVNAYICDFREAGGEFLTLVDGSNRSAVPCLGGDGGGGKPQITRGEIVITANFEPDIPEANTIYGDRVIFHSDDIRESGQGINSNNPLIYGPAKAPDSGSTLEMKILELDKEEAENVSGLLGKLSEIGAKYTAPALGIVGGVPAAAAAATSVFNVMGSLGEALTKTAKDDVEMKFSISFDNPNAIPASNEAQLDKLQTGYIAMVRRENRDASDHFDALVVCGEAGFIGKGGCDPDQEYNGSTWLLLKIVKLG